MNPRFHIFHHQQVKDLDFLATKLLQAFHSHKTVANVANMNNKASYNKSNVKMNK